jgi:heme-degrading monooxygenase HmoA
MLVAIVRIPAPSDPEAAAAMERRLAERLPGVQQSPGFAGFELLRPSEGTREYLSISRWQTRADFDAWVNSAANAQAHGRPAPAADAPAHGGHGGHGGHGPGAGLPPGVELYEVSET